VAKLPPEELQSGNASMERNAYNPANIAGLVNGFPRFICMLRWCRAETGHIDWFVPIEF